MASNATHTIGHVAALARDAAMSTTYKPALLKALVRIVRRDRKLRVPLTAIGAEYLRLYWLQTVVFRLRQAPSLAKESEVVKRIRAAAERYNVRTLADLAALPRRTLEDDLARILRINVLHAFHKRAPGTMPPLFHWSGADYIELTPDACEFIREHTLALESIANLWWAQSLERYNMLTPLIIDKVVRDRVKRGSVSKYLAILRSADGPMCFYCERSVDVADRVHIDHVIPWSFLLADPAWNLVLACARCNASKSDTLPERHFIDKLAAIQVRRAKHVLPARAASMLVGNDEIDRYYDAALSVEWPSGWRPPR